MRQTRFEEVVHVAANLMEDGEMVFSPIAHSHAIAVMESLPGNWEFWQEWGTWFVSRCERFVILKLDGWKESKGVQAETALARKFGKTVEYMECL